MEQAKNSVWSKVKNFGLWIWAGCDLLIAIVGGGIIVAIVFSLLFS